MAETILVAEDNPTLRKVLCKIFEVEKDFDLCPQAVDRKRLHFPDYAGQI
jgi:CheY-like chemotaxis protein